jgi:hypothetical protein
MARKLTQEEAVQRCIDVHGDKYDYSRVVYRGAKEKIEIKCFEHGWFWQVFRDHLSKCGCQVCGKIKNIKSMKSIMGKTTHRFIAQAKKVHGSLYNYKNTKYISAITKVEIECKIHGPFWQYPNNHLKCGCPLCGNETTANKLKSATNDFIKKSQYLYPQQYDYSKVKYINNHTKVEIICNLHGSFWQIPANHWKSGCSKCSYENHPGGYTHILFERQPELKDLPAIYYTLILNKGSEKFIKKGITINRVEVRISQFPYNVEILKEEHMTLFEAFTKEQEIKETYKYLKYKPKIHFGGHTECFTLDIIEEEC